MRLGLLTFLLRTCATRVWQKPILKACEMLKIHSPEITSDAGIALVFMSNTEGGLRRAARIVSFKAIICPSEALRPPLLYVTQRHAPKDMWLPRLRKLQETWMVFVLATMTVLRSINVCPIPSCLSSFPTSSTALFLYLRTAGFAPEYVQRADPWRRRVQPTRLRLKR